MLVVSAGYASERPNPVTGEITTYRTSLTVSGRTQEELLAEARRRAATGARLEVMLPAARYWEEVWRADTGWVPGVDATFEPDTDKRYFKDLAVGETYSDSGYGVGPTWVWEKVDERHVRLVDGPPGAASSKEVDPFETV